MTLRELLKEVKVDVWEDITNEKILNMDIFLIAEDTVFLVDSIEKNFEENRLEIKLLDLD